MGRRLSVEHGIAAVFDEHGPFVWRTLRHLGVDEAAVDDALQDVFVTAVRRLPEFEGRSTMRTWLFGIARRIAFRHRRAAATQRRHIVPTPARVPEGRDEPYARADALHAVRTLIAQLDRDKRAVFVLCELEGMTAVEVADALSVPVGTVHSRRRAAWQRLSAAAARDREALQRHVAELAAEAPDEASHARVRAAMLVAVGSGTASVGTWAGVAVAVVAGLLSVRVALGDPGEPPGSAASPAARRTTAAAPRPTPTPMTAAAPGVATTPRAPVPDAVAPGRPPPREAAAAPARANAARAPVVADSKVDTLSEELKLLAAAKTALRDGDPAVALESLSEHHRDHAHGQLHRERDALVVDAACRIGRVAEARAAARRLGDGDNDPCAR